LQSPEQHILATESPYKIQLFSRLGIRFESIAASIDETPLPSEPAEQLALRLAIAKARHVQTQFPSAWVWGADQVCSGAGRLLGKPGSVAAAEAMLQRLANETAVFYTAVALVGPDASLRHHCELVRVEFRSLTASEITRYVAADHPLDTAGAFKVESLGISLFRRIQSDDPTALEGLPLITVSQWCRELGLHMP